MKKLFILIALVFSINTVIAGGSDKLGKSQSTTNFLPSSLVGKGVPGEIQFADTTELCMQACRAEYDTCIAQGGSLGFCIPEAGDCFELCQFNSGGF